MESNFRYGKAQVEGTNQVTILFLQNTEPMKAILVEDGGYFIGTIKGLMLFMTLFGTLWGLIVLIEWIFFKLKSKRSYKI
jgi:hypothetical protein